MFSLRPNIVVHDYDEFCTLVNHNNGSESQLNPTATEIFRLLISGEPRDIIARHLSSTYQVDFKETLLDVNDLIFQLVSQGHLYPNKDAVYIPYTSWVDNDIKCVFFPTERLIVKCNTVFLQSLELARVTNMDDLEKVSVDNDFQSIANAIGILNQPWDLSHNSDVFLAPIRAVLIPTNACNLNCQYCYAGNQSRLQKFMTKEMAKEAIDLVVTNSFDTGSPRIDISFMGGGEPTVNWDVLEYAIAYMKTLSASLSIPYSATLTTNGYISNDKVEWVAQNFDLIKVSFDGLECVQNAQRPSKVGNSFEVVSNTLRVLTNLKANFLIRCTVTNAFMEHLERSVKYILENFSPNSIIINPVYVCGNCSTSGISSIDISRFCSEFIKIQKLADEHGVDIVTPYDKMTYMYPPKTKYCGFLKGNCFITPDGYLSTCSEIDSAADTRSPLFFFGKWDHSAQKYLINQEKLQQLHNLTIADETCSSSCKSGTFCPGPCLVRRITGTEAEKLFSPTNDPTTMLPDYIVDFIASNSHSPESKIQCAITNKLSHDLCIAATDRIRPKSHISVTFSDITPPPPSGRHIIYSITKISS